MVEAGLNIRSDSRSMYLMDLFANKKENMHGDEQEEQIIIKLELLTKLFTVLVVCLTLSAIVFVFEYILICFILIYYNMKFG